MVNVTVRMPPEMRDELDALVSEFEDKDRSDIIRAAIRAALPAIREKGEELLVEPVRRKTPTR